MIPRGLRERERERAIPAFQKGIPIGNLVSQLFANIYMNEFDQFMKHDLKVKYYVRYTDDFVILHNDKQHLEEFLEPIKKFLSETLRLELHPDKVYVRSLNQGIDFLGYVIRPHCKLTRKRTERRVTRKLKNRIEDYKKGKIKKTTVIQSVHSYLGLLSHANAHRFSMDLKNKLWFWLSDK